MNNNDTIIDIDGVLYICGTAKFFEWGCEQGFNWSFEAYLTNGNNWDLATGLSEREITALYAEFCQSCMPALHAPMPGSQQALRHLQEVPKYVATARSARMQEHCVQELERHFGPFNGYYFSYREKKAHVVRKHAARFFIDDSIIECHKVAVEHPEVEIILFPMRYRHSVSDQNGFRTLKAEAKIHPGISDADWHAVSEAAWQEVVEIILNES